MQSANQLVSSSLILEALCLSRKKRVQLSNLNIDVQDGSTVAIMGRSGAGKTTLLRTIAGLAAPDSGWVQTSAACVPIVFQEPRLLPWRTVRQNLEIALPPDERDRGIEWLERVGLSAVADAYPLTLSGGMRQRVSIARALARDSSLLLVDEPFSHLDVVTANQLRQDLRHHLFETGRTCVWVTHDPDEAATVARQTIIMDGPPRGSWQLISHDEYSSTAQLIAALTEAIEQSSFDPKHQEVS